MVDCDAGSSAVPGQRPAWAFIKGSCNRRRSIASSYPRAIADVRAIAISNISRWIRFSITEIRHRFRDLLVYAKLTQLALRLARHRKVACPGLKCTVSFLRSTTGGERKRRIACHGGYGIALMARGNDWTPICYTNRQLLAQSPPNLYS
jgi:hypothetical protein